MISSVAEDLSSLEMLREDIFVNCFNSVAIRHCIISPKPLGLKVNVLGTAVICSFTLCDCSQIKQKCQMNSANYCKR